MKLAALRNIIMELYEVPENEIQPKETAIKVAKSVLRKICEKHLGKDVDYDTNKDFIFLHPGALITITHDYLEFFDDLFGGPDEYKAFNKGDLFLIISQDGEEENFFKVLCKFGVGFIDGDFILN